MDLIKELAEEDSREQEEIHAEHQAEFFRLLVGTHLRMIVLLNEVSVEPGEVKTELAQTHGLLRNSAVLINSLNRAKPAGACATTALP
jgi:hypothetical protein